jgi:hypothetical protein
LFPHRERALTAAIRVADAECFGQLQYHSKNKEKANPPSRPTHHCKMLCISGLAGVDR